MSALGMLWHMTAERLSLRDALPRRPEPSAIMTEAPRVESFALSGGAQGLLRALYAFHAIQSMCCIAENANVLDLGCGPGQQLLTIAQLHPSAQFVGVDLSEAMLERAERERQRRGVHNVRFELGNLSKLTVFGDSSFDAILCCMTLHHLADTSLLRQVLLDVRRLLRFGGGVYLTDFGRLKRDATVRYLVSDRYAEQSLPFTKDYEDSLRAAFTESEVDSVCRDADLALESYRTVLAPFMWVRRSRVLDRPSCDISGRATQLVAELSAPQQQDLRAIAAWFRLGGLGWPAGWTPAR